MSSEFLRCQEYIKRLKEIYLNALKAFYVFEVIEEYKACNIQGKEQAEKNVFNMNNFKSFFCTVEAALNMYFLLELAKILDEARDSLHLKKLINFFLANREKMSVEEFIKNNKKRKNLDILVVAYKNIEIGDLVEIKSKLEKTKKIREKIKTYRDQHLAHEDLKKKLVKITISDVEEIFDLVDEILNKFSYGIDFSVTSYSRIKRDCKEDTVRLLNKLKD